MFYRFNAHRAKKPQITEVSKNRLAKKIANKILFVQQGWAGFMDHYARKIPVQHLKAMLFVIVMAAGSYCLYLIKDGMFSKAAFQAESIDFRRLWPFDPYGQKEKLRAQSALGYYLDSLEREIMADSLKNPQYYQP